MGPWKQESFVSDDSLDVGFCPFVVIMDMPCMSDSG